MCEKTIKLSVEQARKIYKKSPEMDELLLANFTKEELEKPKLPTSIDDLDYYDGFLITNGEIESASNTFVSKTYRKGRFATKKQAESALAMAQLSQLIAVYNEKFMPNWNEIDSKYCIKRNGNCIVKYTGLSEYNFLAFKSAEIRDEFLKNFEPLIKEYLMID